MGVFAAFGVIAVVVIIVIHSMFPNQKEIDHEAKRKLSNTPEPEQKNDA
jgi:hypothetical protein